MAKSMSSSADTRWRLPTRMPPCILSSTTCWSPITRRPSLRLAGGGSRTSPPPVRPSPMDPILLPSSTICAPATDRPISASCRTCLHNFMRAQHYMQGTLKQQYTLCKLKQYCRWCHACIACRAAQALLAHSCSTGSPALKLLTQKGGLLARSTGRRAPLRRRPATAAAPARPSAGRWR